MPKKKVTQKTAGAKAKQYTQYLQERKYELFQRIPGLVDACFVEVPKPHILLKTVIEISPEAYPIIQDSGLEFEVKVLESKDSLGKPIVVTDSGIKNPARKDEDGDTDPSENSLNDFVTVGVDKNGQTTHHKVKGQRDVVDLEISPADMVFKPGEL